MNWVPIIIGNNRYFKLNYEVHLVDVLGNVSIG